MYQWSFEWKGESNKMSTMAGADWSTCWPVISYVCTSRPLGASQAGAYSGSGLLTKPFKHCLNITRHHISACALRGLAHKTQQWGIYKTPKRFFTGPLCVKDTLFSRCAVMARFFMWISGIFFSLLSRTREVCARLNSNKANASFYFNALSAPSRSLQPGRSPFVC